MVNRNKIEKLENNYLGLRTSDGAGIYLIAFVFLYIAQIAVIAIGAMADMSKDGLTINYIAMAVNQVVFFSAPFIYGKIFSREMLKPSRINIGLNVKQIVIVSVIAIACILAFLPLSELFTRLMKLSGYNYNPGLPLADPTRWWTLPLSIFFVAFLPAIGEEFLFRGSVARAFKVKSYCFAMIMSAVLFAIFHGNAMQLVHQFFLGLVMCFCYFVTRSLLAPMIIHFLNNAISLVIIYIQGLSAMNGTAQYNPGIGTQVGIYSIMFVFGVILLIILLRTLTRESKIKAGIAVEKISAKAMFSDIGRAFYPKGIKKNYNKLNRMMKELYADPIDDIPLVDPIIDEHLDVENEQLRKQLMEADKEMNKKRKRIDRNAVAIAVGISAAIWLINLVGAYLK